MPEDLKDARSAIADYFRSHSESTPVVALIKAVRENPAGGRKLKESAIRNAFWLMVSDGRLQMDFRFNVHPTVGTATGRRRGGDTPRICHPVAARI